MDATDYPSLGRLAVLNAQLALQNRQVENFVDSRLDGIDKLIHAAALSDWETVLSISEQLIAQLKDPADATLVHSAKQLCELLRRDPSGAKVSGRLTEFLSACRAAKSRSGRMSS